MRLLFIRHSDPDYEHDSLTEKGRREAELLSRLAPDLNLGDVYVSPLGRAQETASYCLKTTGKKARAADWLMEFGTDLDLNEYPNLRRAYGNIPLLADLQKRPGGIESHKSYWRLLHPESIRRYLDDMEKDSAGRNVPKYAPSIVWDVLPSYLREHPELLDPVDWKHTELAKAGHVEECADYVISHFDAMLKEHGYRRDGSVYAADRPNKDTVTCFCHLGLTCLLISYLTNQSPFTVWTYCAFAPSSVTEFVTEEREKGIAIFRGLRFGDISHLAVGGEKPSFSARFCETYDSADQRH